MATPFVAFADADDRFPPGYFAFAVERLRARPGVVAVGMRPVALDDASGEERAFPWPTDGAIAASRHRRRLALRGLLKEPSIVMSGSVFRADAVRRAGGYSDLSYGEDANLALLLPFLGDVELHRAPNRRYRIHPGSIARRPPSRETLEATFADARRRLREHRDVPVWAKLLLPAVRRYHDRRIASALDGSYGEGAAPRRRGARRGRGPELEAYGGAGRLARRAAPGRGRTSRSSRGRAGGRAPARRWAAAGRRRRVRGRAARHPVVAAAAGLVVL